jgi:hypothetical protein
MTIDELVLEKQKLKKENADLVQRVSDANRDYLKLSFRATSKGQEVIQLRRDMAMILEELNKYSSSGCYPENEKNFEYWHQATQIAKKWVE